MKKDFTKSFTSYFDKLGVYITWVLVLILLVSAVRNIGEMFRIRGEVEKEKLKLAKIETENKELSDQIASAQSSDFIEREIRNKLGLVRMGEAEVVLPDPEILRKLAPKLALEEDILPAPNWEKWLKLFF